jgi:hypothetical protein
MVRVPLRNACKWSGDGVVLRLVRSVPRCSLRGRSGARQPRHARAKERAARGSGWLRSSLPLRCAPRLERRQVGTGKQGHRSNRKADLGRNPIDNATRRREHPDEAMPDQLGNIPG